MGILGAGLGSASAGAGNVIGQGLGLANATGLLSELTGEPTKVQFLRDGVGTIFQFDACLNENHQREASPTEFPLESGSIVSDHILIPPLELSLTGVVADFPIYDAKKLITQAVGVAAAAVLPPLGVTLGSAAYKLYTLTHAAASPSKQAYQTLMSIQSGKPDESPPQLPEPFTVLTHYARYTNMVIKSLAFPRDASNASTCVFNLTLTQIRLVQPQFVNLAILKNPGLAADKRKLGEADAEEFTAVKDGIKKADEHLKTGVDVARAAVKAAQPGVDALKSAASVFGF